jgi:hypothetical protein
MLDEYDAHTSNFSAKERIPTGYFFLVKYMVRKSWKKENDIVHCCLSKFEVDHISYSFSLFDIFGQRVSIKTTSTSFN